MVPGQPRTQKPKADLQITTIINELGTNSPRNWRSEICVLERKSEGRNTWLDPQPEADQALETSRGSAPLLFHFEFETAVCTAYACSLFCECRPFDTGKDGAEVRCYVGFNEATTILT